MKGFAKLDADESAYLIRYLKSNANNGLNKISKINLEIAQAQYEQALSANYPSLNAVLYANRDDTDTIFQQRGVFNLPASLVGAISALTPPGTPATSFNCFYTC